jgi:hypothetical protein
MISNITNALPVFLKNIKNNSSESINENFNLIESLKFYGSIFPKGNSLIGLKHLYFDVMFKLKPEKMDLLKSFYLTIDSIDFLKEFKYILDDENGVLVMRGNMEEFGILSLILIGSIKELKPDNPNKSIFISACALFLEFCLNNNYKVCKHTDIDILDSYNEGFDDEMFEAFHIVPTSDAHIGTFHFIGIEINADILYIFENYKDVKFSFNKENASFVITMDSKNWDDFWLNAPAYLKNEFQTN